MRILNILLISSIFIASSLFAEIRCSGGAGFTPISCTNMAPGNRSMVKMKRMPSWDGNAGLTQIDICNVKTDIQTDEEETEYTLTPNEEIIEEDLECIHRYCSSDGDFFVLSVNLMPLPLGGGIFFDFGVGFSESSFEVRCENINNN